MDRDSKTLGVVIKTENVKEKDRIISLLTPDDGVIKVLVYGAQKSLKSIKAPLYSEGMFSLYKKSSGEIYTLKDVDLIALHEYISEDLDRIAVASLFSELILKSRSLDPSLYKLYTDAIDYLETVSYRKVVVAFAMKFLELSGLVGDYKTCPVCGRVYRDDEVLGFSASLSTAVCSDCDTMEGRMILPPSARRYLERVLSSDFALSLSLRLSDEQLFRVYRYVLRTLLMCFSDNIETLSSGLLIV